MALPSGYTKLEYIESTGTQYIDTGVSAPSGVAISCEVMLTGYVGSYNSIFGAHDTNSPYYRDYLAAKNNGIWELGAYGFSQFGAPALNIKLKIDCCTISGAISCVINGAAQSVDTTIGGNGVRSSLSMYLFGMNYSGGINPAKMRLYSCKIYLDSSKTNLVRDFIPCKNVSGTVGLWDSANSKFYSGTGGFTAGPPLVDLTAHKTLINGTAYTVQGGKCMVNGTVYNILKGRTLIDGTGWDITFPSAVTMPAKGDLITMNLDGTDRQYRVLKIVDRTTVEVLGMWDANAGVVFNRPSNVYSGSNLDTYLNTTWYNTLSSAAKNAIVAKAINQYQYIYNASVYNSNTHASYADYSTKALKANIGNRYIYALDIEDIEMYFGGTGGSTSDKVAATFSNADIWQMFWNAAVASNRNPIWLRSARDGYSDVVWYVYAFGGSLTVSNIIGAMAARPAFQIDLSKIDFTIGGGNVSKTWTFDTSKAPTSMFPNLSAGSNQVFSVSFTSNGQRYIGFRFSHYYMGDNLGYATSSGGITVYDFEGGWTIAYATVTFDEAPSGDLLTWLQANATPQ